MPKIASSPSARQCQDERKVPWDPFDFAYHKYQATDSYRLVIGSSPPDLITLMLSDEHQRRDLICGSRG